MLVIQNLRRRQKRLKMSEVKYDETLISLLVMNGFNHKNISNLIPVTRFYANARSIVKTLNMIRENFNSGYVFALSSGLKNGMFFYFHTFVSPDEIRRRLELKAFL